MADRTFTDEELVAFLDGEEDHAPAAAIREALKEDAVLRQRLDALQIDKQAISDGFAALLAQDRPAPVLPETPASRGYGLGSLALVASLALAIGLSSGAYLTRAPQPGWLAYVAAYQALYSTETLSHIQQDETAQQVELDRVAVAIGKMLTPAELDMLPGAEYKRAQVLSFNGKPLIQLTFLTEGGDPLALCIIRSNKGRSPQPELSQMEGMSAAVWGRDGYEYLLIGGQDDAQISRYAEVLSTADV
ncbi:hypothetical protein TRL7639_03933 [Falsiruegeria litorea R37]|uniref:Transmembrane transcriptional regulator (Anti-sigma factor) n=1 Tax=Falsiruegeria litorea R37 TaxID=1200284 RepID=A0A1Y5TNA3_9RHOB|nr:hypothetical protein [Falsiruegeria litorea]SLN67978.1 hypothetical protein TRL7639_03933 [Falsiruegeria litorea R37]